MKILEKIICILHTHLFNEIPTGLHNSLNLRLVLAVVDDNLPVNVSY